ncbi:MAG: hypothetical protein KF745_05210 [Phycisphaeraceae bacterium]|nr:hypothetical protein [Phycisphaeraceae bacterium]
MQRDRRVQLAATILLVLCLGVSAVLSSALAASAGRNRLVYADQGQKGDPPEVAAGIAMGAFRGLFVNMLWIRANQLKEEGKYYEAVDLAKTITRLQPRFPRVWVFHAWNLAYNISVATQTPQERWQWVQAGIRLLRDEGIPANPTDTLLHKELAWILLHKVQGQMDDANWTYKREFAREWTYVLGTPPARTKDRDTTAKMKQAYIEWLEKIANASDTISELDASTPGASEVIEKLRTQAGIDLTGRLWDEAGNGPGERLLQIVEELRSFGRLQSALGLTAGPRSNLSASQRAAMDILMEGSTSEGPTPAVQAVVRFVRKRILIDKYHMEPDRMIRYTKDAGPLDWRHPASHAYYWSTRGVDEALYRINAKNRGDFDILNTDRVAIQALQELYRSGEISFDIFNPGFYLQLPNPDFIDAYDQILARLVDRSQFVTDKGEVVTPDKGRPWSQFSAGYENFLRDVIRYLYRRGDREKAEEYRQKLIHFDRRNLSNDLQYVYLDTLPLDEFVVSEIARDDRFTSPEVARSEVTGALQAAFWAGLLADNFKLFESQMKYARDFHARFTKDKVFDTNVTRGDQTRMEVMDRDFDTYAARILANAIIFTGLPDGSIMYNRAPDDLKIKAYQLLAGSPLAADLDAVEASGGSGFSIWFPPPPGLEEYRKNLLEQARLKAENQGTIEKK